MISNSLKLNISASILLIIIETLLQQAGRSLNQKDGEVKDSQFRIASLSEEVARLKKLVEVTQVGCTLVCGACINKLCLASVSSSREVFLDWLGFVSSQL